MSRRKIVFVILSVVALLPIMIMRDFTPANELRYMSIADEAIADGHLFAFYNQGEPYADKPPLYFWLVMLGRVLFGSHQMWFLSLLSLLPAMVIIGVMNRWVLTSMDKTRRQSAALMLATGGMFLGVAVFLRMDMLMTMFITLALYLFWRLYVGEGGRREQWLFPVCVFLALFSKGPVGLLMPLLVTVCFLILQHKWRDIARYWGWRSWCVLLVGCAVWFGCVWLEGGSEYLDNLLFHQTMDRAVNAFHHKEPVWFYCTAIWWSMAPWSIFAVTVIVVSLWRGGVKTELERFFLTIVVTTFIMLSVFSSKIAIYLLPIFPFIIYLAMLCLPNVEACRWLKWTIAVPAVISCLALPAVLVVGYFTDIAPIMRDAWLVVGATILSLSALVVLKILWREDTIHRAVKYFVAAIFVAIFFAGFAIPHMNKFFGYQVLCEQAERLLPGTDSKIYTWHVRRSENMDVYLKRDVLPVTAEQILSGECSDGVLILRRSRLDRDESVKEFVVDRLCWQDARYAMVVL